LDVVLFQQKENHSISNGHFQIHHPKECATNTSSTINQTILIECISTICDFDKPSDGNIFLLYNF